MTSPLSEDLKAQIWEVADSWFTEKEASQENLPVIGPIAITLSQACFDYYQTQAHTVEVICFEQGDTDIHPQDFDLYPEALHASSSLVKPQPQWAPLIMSHLESKERIPLLKDGDLFVSLFCMACSGNLEFPSWIVFSFYAKKDGRIVRRTLSLGLEEGLDARNMRVQEGHVGSIHLFI